jgi:hypothetical protein
VNVTGFRIFIVKEKMFVPNHSNVIFNFVFAELVVPLPLCFSTNYSFAVFITFSPYQSFSEMQLPTPIVKAAQKLAVLAREKSTTKIPGL